MAFQIHPHPYNPQHQQPVPPPHRQAGSIKSRGHPVNKADFHTRVETVLRIEDIEQPLCRENYKTKLHNLICWEEKRHIEVLEEK